jgi:hypothetical protein
MSVVTVVFQAAIVVVTVALAIVVIVDALPSSRCTCYACARRRAESGKRPW